MSKFYQNYLNILYILFGLLLMIILLFIAILPINAFTLNQETYLAKQCFNVSFIECQDIRNLYNQTNAQIINFTQSNETNLIKNVENKLIQNISILGKDFADNFTLVNQKINSLDFSKYNDTLSITSVNQTLLVRISSLENKLNTLAGNNTDLTFQTMFSNAIKLQQYRQQKKQIDSIFQDPNTQLKTSVLTLDNLKSYVNQSELNLRLSQLSTSQQPLDTSRFLDKNFIFILFGILGIGFGYLFIENNKLKVQLQTKSKELEIETSYDTPEINEKNDKGKKLKF